MRETPGKPAVTALAPTTAGGPPSWPAPTASERREPSRPAEPSTRSSGCPPSRGPSGCPFSLKVLLENLLRTEDGANVTADHIRALAGWDPTAEPDTEIQFTPARVIMQDFTGVPCVVDLATMREAVTELGGDPAKVNPLAPAELVIDHSVIIDVFGRAGRLRAQRRLRVPAQQGALPVPALGPGRLRRVQGRPAGHRHRAPGQHRAPGPRRHDPQRPGLPGHAGRHRLHTTMVNGLGVLGWGVGGIEAEAAMLGQPVSMLIPKVVGFKLTGEIPAGATATDVVLTITEMLRRHGVVGKFVEFYGEGVGAVPLANRATIGNMSPEFGSTAAIFPIDDETVRYLKLTGRPAEQLELVEAYAKEQGLWHDPAREPVFSETLELDLSTVVPSIAGPKRPQDRIELSDGQACVPRPSWSTTPAARTRPTRTTPPRRSTRRRRVGRGDLPGQRPGRTRQPVRGRGPAPVGVLGRRGRGRPREPAGDRHPRRRRVLRARPRRRRDLLDHLVHQHVEPVGDARRRAAGQERRRPGPHGQAVGEDVDGARLEGRHRLLREGRPLAVPGEAGLPPGRLRLHHLHRQLRAAGRGDLGRRSTRATSPWSPCCRATGTSRAGSTRTSR